MPEGVLSRAELGLQVLAACVRTRAAFGRVTRWQDPSPELCSGAARLGLESLLGLAKPGGP